MEAFIERTEKIPFYRNYDVIVAGGGVAGVAAALAAVREGKRVLLIEKTCILGGLATIGHINFFVPMCNGRGKQIIAGMAEELLRLSVRYGLYDPVGMEERGTVRADECPVSHEVFPVDLRHCAHRSADGVRRADPVRHHRDRRHHERAELQRTPHPE